MQRSFLPFWIDEASDFTSFPAITYVYYRAAIYEGLF